MSKERLEEIRKRTLISTSTFGDIEVIHIEYHDYDWIIKEVEKLQNYLEVYENTLGHMDNKNIRYKEALKYYSLSNDPLIALKALGELK